MNPVAPWLHGILVAVFVWVIGTLLLALGVWLHAVLYRPRHRMTAAASCSMTAGWAPRGDVVRAHGAVQL